MSQLSPRWEQDGADYSYTLIDNFGGFYRVQRTHAPRDGKSFWIFGWSEYLTYMPLEKGGLRVSHTLFETAEDAAAAAENIACLDEQVAA